jgi:hypothetical protein
MSGSLRAPTELRYRSDSNPSNLIPDEDAIET